MELGIRNGKNSQFPMILWYGVIAKLVGEQSPPPTPPLPRGGGQLRHGIVAAPSPRVAAQDAAGGKVKPFENAVPTERFQRVLRTGGRKPARRG